MGTKGTSILGLVVMVIVVALAAAAASWGWRFGARTGSPF
jgi:hypothetical protein